ncbi:MAG: hypothetical protein LBL73_00160 [Synergistaceae bacterium]|jgi:hypothetical protein|nr:hypothetical protein [Synergistaceae bacterium]
MSDSAFESPLFQEQAEEQAPQEQQAQEQTPEQTPEPQQQQPQPQAPESYEPFTPPEGMYITEDDHNELVALGKEMKLTQAQMQTLVNYGGKKIGDGMEAARLEIMKRWQKESENDPEISAGIDHARRLVTNVGDEKFREEFKSMVDDTGIGYNPVFIRFCIQAGRLLGEDAFIKSGGPDARPDTLTGIAHSVYRDM